GANSPNSLGDMGRINIDSPSLIYLQLKSPASFRRQGLLLLNYPYHLIGLNAATVSWAAISSMSSISPPSASACFRLTLIARNCPTTLSALARCFLLILLSF